MQDDERTWSGPASAQCRVTPLAEMKLNRMEGSVANEFDPDRVRLAS